MTRPGPSSAIYNPEHWRIRAGKMRLLAEDLHDVESKATMLRIAEKYDVLADRAAKRLKDNAG